MTQKYFIYQIYPVSFKDTTGNGRGDIKGIIEKIPYLSSLGIDYIWVTPFFKSPFIDNGYDISNYYDVDPKFGENKDLIELIKRANEYGIKIMLDMVFNHTSIEHKWFKGWISGDKKYKDFYIGKHSVGKPPTNWKSKFGGSAWEEYKKDYWYLHLFSKQQADLNWENRNVRKELKKILMHYIKLGVKGFRFDVINLISKSKFVDGKNDGRYIYTDGPKVGKYLEEIRNELPNNIEFITVGELSSTSKDISVKYANKDKTQLDMVFTFHHLKIDYDGTNKFVDKSPDINLLNNILKEWYEYFSKKKSNMANFLTNHDQPRAVSRFIHKKYREVGAKMLFALTSSLPGSVYIYQGEEIAMENLDYKNVDDFRDIETLSYVKDNNLSKIPKGILQKSRDNARTPMQWDSSVNSGFTSGNPWIKVNKNYKDINVKKQLYSKNSVLNFYRDMISFSKKDSIISNGDIVFLDYKNEIISFTREFNDEKYKFTFSFNRNEINYSYNLDNVIKSNYQKLNGNILKPYQFIIERI